MAERGGCALYPARLVCWYAQAGETQTETENRICADRLEGSRNPQTGKSQRSDPGKAEAARLRLEGLSLRAIGQRLGVSQTTVARWLAGRSH